MEPNDLHWTESNIEKFDVNDRDLVIYANSVFHPKSTKPCNVKVIFKGVLETKREMTEYIGDPQDNPSFKKPYVIEDLPKQNIESEFITYGLEGITSFEPISWVDWEVKAKEIYVSEI